MKNISHAVLCARFLTPLQDCKVCSELDSKDPEVGQQECKAGILANIDAILMDAENVLDSEVKKEFREQYEMFIALVIIFKKVCFKCECNAPMMLDFYNEIGENLESYKEQTSDREKSIKREASILQCIKKN